MEFDLDRDKKLKFQLSSQDMSDEGKERLEGLFTLQLDGYSLGFSVELNENWVATVNVPKLKSILKNYKGGEAHAKLCLHDDEYFFKVWEEDVEVIKGRPELKAKVVEDEGEDEGEDKGKGKGKKKAPKAKVEAAILEDEVEVVEESKVTKDEGRTPDFQKSERDPAGKGLKSFLDHLDSKE